MGDTAPYRSVVEIQVQERHANRRKDEQNPVFKPRVCIRIIVLIYEESNQENR